SLLPTPTPSPYTTLFRSLRFDAEREDAIAAPQRIGDAVAASHIAEKEVGRGPVLARADHQPIGREQVLARAFVYGENFELAALRSEEHTSELQSPDHLVC